MSHELFNHRLVSKHSTFNFPTSRFYKIPWGSESFKFCFLNIYIYIYIYILITYFLVRSSDYINWRIINEWYVEKNVGETDRGTFKSTFWCLLGRSEKTLKSFGEVFGHKFKPGTHRMWRNTDVCLTSKFLT